MAHIGLAAVVLVMAALGIEMTLASGRIASFWWANAVVLAVLLRVPVRSWPGWLLAGLVGNVAADLITGDVVSHALVLSACNSLEIALAAGLMRGAVPRGHIDLSRLRALVPFIGLAALVAPAPAGLLAGLFLSHTSGAALLSVFRTWYTTDALGILIVVPLLNGLNRQELADSFSGWRWLAFGAVVLFAVGLMAGVFYTEAFAWIFLVSLVCVAAALLFGFLGGSAATLAVAGTALSVIIVRHPGVTLSAEVRDHIQFLQFFLLANTLVSLPAAGLFRRASLNARRYRGLFDQIPLPAFAVSDHALRITEVNAAAIAAYGYTREELLGLSVEALWAPGGGPEARPAMAKARQGPAVREAKHRTKDGAVMDVEATVRRFESPDWRGSLVIARDVTERNETLRQLHASEEELLTITQATMDGFWVVDTDARILEVNDVVCQRLGYSREELLTMSAGDLEVMADPEAIRQNMRALAVKRRAVFEGLHRCRDGSLVNIEGSAVYSGHTGRIMVFLRDITERKRAQAIMQARMDLADHSASTSPEALLVATLDVAEPLTGSEIGFYHTFEEDEQQIRLTAWSTHTTQSLCTAEGAGSHYPLRDAGIWADCIRQRRTIIYNDYESDPGRKGLPSGHASVKRILVAPIFRGQRIVGVIGLGNKRTDYNSDDADVVTQLADAAWDITERKRAELALRDSEARWQFALEGAGEGVWDWDPRSDRIFFSHQWKAMLGFQEDEIGDTLSEWKERVHPDDLGRVMAELDAHLKGESAEFVNEHRLRAKDGTYRWVLDRGKVIERAPDGTPCRVIGTHFDITEHRRLEEQLRQAQKLEAVGQLAGGIAHDFNNLITPIMGYTDLLMERFEKDSKERDYLSVIASSSRRARDLVSRILMFSRKSESSRTILSLEESVTEVVALLRSTLPANVRVGLQCAPDLPPIDADQTEMNQLLMNLCVNAGHAMPLGGDLTIRLDTVVLQQCQCLFGVALTGRFVAMTVEDTGIGMDEQTKAHIFEPFFTTRGNQGGTGLGLATVYAIVQRHQGGLQLDSQPGRGTRFRMYFRAVTPGPAHAESTSAQSIPGRAGRILVVDDEPEVVGLYETVLVSMGHQVESVMDGNRALELFSARSGEFDLVITDMSMPGLSGADLASQLQEIRDDVRIVLCTGGEGLSPEAARASGIRELLRKPVEVETLMQTVTTALAN